MKGIGGLYDKCVRRVTTGDNTETEVLVYIGPRQSEVGRAQDGYLERILAAAVRAVSRIPCAAAAPGPDANTFRAWNQLLNWMKSGRHVE